MGHLKRLLTDQQGMELSEYAIMSTLILTIIIGVIGSMGTLINGRFTVMATTIAQVIP